MKRRNFIGKAGLLGVGLGATARANTPNSGSELLVRTPAVIMAPRNDGAEIIWAVSRLARGTVEWKDKEGNTGRVYTDSFGFHTQGQLILKVPLVNLRPGTEYAIRIITEALEGNKEQITSSWEVFKTLDGGSGKSAHFVVWNDTHINNETIQRLNEITPKADFLLWNGDTCNNWTSEELFVPTLLYPGERDITQGRPLFITMGNHDVRGKYGFEIARYIAMPKGVPYYSLRQGPLAAIFLNTGEDKPDDHVSFAGRVSFEAHRREQAEWLKKEIQRPEIKNAPFRVVFCHIPLRLNKETVIEHYDDAGKRFDHFARSSRELWHESLLKWGAQVVISGHLHRQEWVAPSKEFPYAQIIGGGPKMEAARYIEGKIEGDKMKIRLHNMENEVTMAQEFAALA